MKKFSRFILALAVAATAGSAFTGCDSDSKKLQEKEKELAELRQLAELDKREMENQYAEFAARYSEMKKSIKDDSLVAALDAEQRRSEELLKELKAVKANSSAEILRLKKELATMRVVMQDYIRQIDSLQQQNLALRGERDAARADADRFREENSALGQTNASLSEKVNVAARLYASNVKVEALKANGKVLEKLKKRKEIKTFRITFTIARNVTAETGNRTFYIRMLSPTRNVIKPQGSTNFEDRQVQYSAARTVAYDGSQTSVIANISTQGEVLTDGVYSVLIIESGNLIGEGRITLLK